MKKIRQLLIGFIIIVSLLRIEGELAVPISKISSTKNQNWNFGSFMNNTLSQPTIDYLIITSESLLSTIYPLALWKQQRGLQSYIVTVEDILQNYDGIDTQEAIRECIKSFYEEKNITWVLLAGNHDYVPTRSVRINRYYIICDQYYANLDNNWILNSDGSVSIINYFDWEAEVYVGRLPAENIDQMKIFIERQLNYERNPPIGPWMNHALFAGAFANFDTDINDNSILDVVDYPEFDSNRVHNWLKTNVLPMNWTSTLLAETAGIKSSNYYYDESLNETTIIETINAGVGIGNIDSHGSMTGMARLIFVSDQDNDLLFDSHTDGFSFEYFIDTQSNIDTEGKNGFYFLSSCETGHFEVKGDSLAEYLLRTGGIGVIASSTNAYYEEGWYERAHGGWYSQGLETRFWQQFFSGTNQPGKAFINAKIDYVEDYITFNGLPEDRNKTLLQYNLLGDPEVPIWTTIPSQLESEISYTNNRVILKVISENQVVTDAIVTLINSTYFWKEITNSSGQIILPSSLDDFNTLNITISKNNYIPYQNSLRPPQTTPIKSTTSTKNTTQGVVTPPLTTRSNTPSFELLLGIASIFTIFYRKNLRKSRRK